MKKKGVINMWIKGRSAKVSSNDNYKEKIFLTLNFRDSGYAIKVSEKARKELGWEKGDFLNVYVDNEKIMLIKDNESREFPLSIYKHGEKIYGFTLHGKDVKNVCNDAGWLSKKIYSADISTSNGEKYLICFKDDKVSQIERALLEKKVKTKLV